MYSKIIQKQKKKSISFYINYKIKIAHVVNNVRERRESEKAVTARCLSTYIPSRTISAEKCRAQFLKFRRAAVNRSSSGSSSSRE